jgi:hypothetical protein
MKENSIKIIKFMFITIFIPIYIAILIYESQQLDNITKKQLKYFDATMKSIIKYNNYQAKVLESNYTFLIKVIDPVTDNIHSFLNNKKLKDNDMILDKYIQSLNTQELNTSIITNYTKQKKDYEEKSKKEILNIQRNYMFLRIYSNDNMNLLTDKINELLSKSDKAVKMIEKVEQLYGNYLNSFIDLNKVFVTIYTKKNLRMQYSKQYEQLNVNVKKQIKEIKKAIECINELDKDINNIYYKTMHEKINANALSKIWYATFKKPDNNIFPTKEYPKIITKKECEKLFK